MRPRGEHVAYAAGSGALATLALLVSPLGSQLPPLFLPWAWVGWIDLRLVALPFTFTWTFLLASRARWPGPATALVGVALASALPAHLHASAVLDYIGADLAQPGSRVNLLSFAASVGSILLALHVALDLARTRFLDTVRSAGVAEEQLDKADGRARSLATQAMTTAALAVVVLAFVLRVGDALTGRQRIPLAEVVALGLVLAIGAVLLGVRVPWLERRSG